MSQRRMSTFGVMTRDVQRFCTMATLPGPSALGFGGTGGGGTGALQADLQLRGIFADGLEAELLGMVVVRGQEVKFMQ